MMKRLKIRELFFYFSLIILVVACSRTPAETPEPTPVEAAATATPTAEPPATSTPMVASATPEEADAVTDPTATAVVDEPLATPAAIGAMTVTPYPGATPTSGPLNDPVPTVPTGEYECGDYPCFDDAEAWIERIALPEGFEARYVAQIEPHPTSFTFGPDGLLYVARQEGEIVTVDADGNVESFIDGFYYLVAIAFQPGTERLFASTRVEGNEAATIWVIEDGEAQPLYEDLPCCYGGWHQANGIAFGPDGYGYVSVGALSDHGEQQPLHPLEASVLRFDPAGGEIEVFARGLRNTFDITWDGSGRLFGADNMPDHGPPEEFNRIEPGSHHGFPYYDDCAGCEAPPDDLEIVPALHKLLAHSAPTGVTSYLAQQFPGYYNNIFLTLWSAFPGAQKIVRFGPDGEGMTDFATGFAAPIDVTVSPDGSLYVVDWATGIVFEIAYSGNGIG